VDAEAERGVAVLLAVDDHPVGVGEHLRIAIGGGEGQQHHLARLEGAAVDLLLPDDLAGHGHRRIGAQELLDRRRYQGGLADQAAAVVGMRGEVPDARADAAPGGVDAGDQQKPQGADQVLLRQRLAVAAHLGEKADQIVAGLGRALAYVSHEIGLHLLGRSERHLDVGDAVLEHHLDPLAVEVAVGLRQSEHVGDQAHRDLLRVRDRRVGKAALGELVDEFVGERPGARLELVDGVRGERGQQQHARRAVLGRIGGDRRGRDARGRRLAHDHAP